MCLLATT